MSDRLLEGRAAQRLVARLAPPFDREVVEARLSEMVRDRLGLHAGFTQDFRRAAVKRLAAAFQQAFVGGVLDQRVLEAIGRLRRDSFNEQDVGFGQPLKGRLQR